MRKTTLGKTTNITVRLGEPDKARLDEVCLTQDLSHSQVVRKLIKDGIERMRGRAGTGVAREGTGDAKGSR